MLNQWISSHHHQWKHSNLPDDHVNTYVYIYTYIVVVANVEFQTKSVKSMRFCLKKAQLDNTSGSKSDFFVPW